MTGALNNPTPPTESNGAVPVNIQDQHTDGNLLLFHEIAATGALALDTAVDDTTVSLAAGHGMAVGELLVLKEGMRIYSGVILSLPANVATVDTPLDYAYTVAGASVHSGTYNLNLVGSLGSPRIAQVSPPPGIEWDITRIHVRMTDATVMDAGTFGGIPALTNGVVLRYVNARYKNIGNAKTNGDLILLSSDYRFDEKPPSGKYGFTSKHVFAGQEHVGVTVRLDGSMGDTLQILIQDDLSGNEVLAVRAMGHVVTD